MVYSLNIYLFVQIAIMGCIVNGPGEMADADFGYVGGSPGKIDLYVGKVCAIHFMSLVENSTFFYLSYKIFFVSIHEAAYNPDH